MRTLTALVVVLVAAWGGPARADDVDASVVMLPCVPAETYSPGLAVDGREGRGRMAPGGGTESGQGAGECAPAASEAGLRTVPCTPVTTMWPGGRGERDGAAGPALAVVRTHIRPNQARVYLDGRFIGRARYFNGSRGFLFLEPGRYRLELRFGGYEPELFSIDARPGCRFDILHRMNRISGEPKESRYDPPGRGYPHARVFGPCRGEAGVAEASMRRGPDLALRPGLERSAPAEEMRGAVQSSLRLSISPGEASLYIDGTFVATAGELDKMVNPLALAAGAHVVEVRAPGFIADRREIELEAGRLIELAIELQPTPDGR